MRRIIAVGLVMLPSALWAEDWREFTGGQIGVALTARVLAYDDGAMQNFFADGRTLYEAGAGESWGRWWVKGDKYCSVWPPSNNPACYVVEGRGLKIRFVASDGQQTTGHYIDLN